MPQSTALAPFTAPDGALLRVVMRDGEPWFSAADACAQLDLENVGQAAARLDEDEKTLVSATVISSDSQTVGRGGARNVLLVSEAGLYALIMTGRTAAAKAFKRWVTHEVLPEIRRTGGYGAPAAQRELSRREILQMALDAEDRADRAEAELEAAKPALTDHAAFMAASGAIPVGVAAQQLGTGEIKLFEFLRRHKVLKSIAGAEWNMPYTRHVDLDRFTVVSGTRRDRNGEPVTTYTTRVRPKGMAYIRSLVEEHGRAGL